MRSNMCADEAGWRVRALPKASSHWCERVEAPDQRHESRLGCCAGLSFGRGWFELRRERWRTWLRRRAHAVILSFLSPGGFLSGQTECQRGQKVPTSVSNGPHLAHTITKPPPTDPRVGTHNVHLSKSLRTTNDFPRGLEDRIYCTPGKRTVGIPTA